MNKTWLVSVALCSAGTALAQDAGFTVTVGARAWRAEWTTFGYVPDPRVEVKPPAIAIKQVEARTKVVLMPVVNVRYGDFSGTISAMPSTAFSFIDGGGNRRQEMDVNLGYDVMPGLTATLGYKKVSQIDVDTGDRYRPAGPVVGLNGSASLSAPWSLYGSVGVGKFSSPKPIEFKANYRLTELGLAYALTGGQFVKRWTFTAGYRIQVLTSKEAFYNASADVLQDAIDTTQGFTFGVLATF